MNTCTEVFNNWRSRRRLSGLEVPLRIICYASENKIVQRSSGAKVTEVQRGARQPGLLISQKRPNKLT